ncbi:hypothetical protein BN1723_019343, partial [Verticillium longisporum]
PARGPLPLRPRRAHRPLPPQHDQLHPHAVEP